MHFVDSISAILIENEAKIKKSTIEIMLIIAPIFLLSKFLSGFSILLLSCNNLFIRACAVHATEFQHLALYLFCIASFVNLAVAMSACCKLGLDCNIYQISKPAE